MSFEPTTEQQAIVSAVKGTSDSLLINALAGAAKTSTLVLAAHKLPLIPAISVAFNKKIADEMSLRLPSHIVCSTLNSLGHRVWSQKLGKRLQVDSGKMYSILSEMQDGLKGEDKKQFGSGFASLLRATRLAKASGYIPDRLSTVGKSLVSKVELGDSLAAVVDSVLDDQFFFWLDQSLERSIAQGFEASIDFDDQIYLSTLFSGRYPKFPVVMVDEAQDLSPLNHETISQMVSGRLIAVGDPCQSIYGFRGAHTTSMEVLRERFQMKELTLSISFRCPKEIVLRARVRAPHMQWPDWAKEGHVERLESWSADDITDGAAVICRNNAPLFRAALRLIRAGRGVRLLGSDIGKSLVKILEKLGEGNPTSEDFVKLIDEWEANELKKAKREAQKASISDRAECLRVFAEIGKDKRDAISYAKTLFESSGPIQLMSGHKSKGLEFDTVFYLDSFLCPSKRSLLMADAGDASALEQERNLNYVILTRSQNKLFFIDTRDYK